MPKNTKVMFVCILLIGIAVGTCIGVTADTVIKDITVQVNSAVKYKLNGNEFIPKNVDGSKMDTLIYNGRSYVPLRAIADAFKVAVDWDGTTSTIILGEREGKGVSMLDLKPKLDNFYYDTEYHGSYI
ncbi:MAG TPA: stalk domain-containing protein [Acetivibrio clariflavus]|nr:stalk domain-containing protein [Acetivibrio clariflavus]